MKPVEPSPTQLFSGANSFSFFLGGCPTKNGLPKKGEPMVSLKGITYLSHQQASQGFHFTSASNQQDKPSLSQWNHRPGFVGNQKTTSKEPPDIGIRKQQLLCR